MREGFDVVAEAIGLKEKIRCADIVVTGEGKLDAQTLEGKTPAGVARLTRELGKPVYAIVGEAVNEDEVRSSFDRVFPLVRPPITRTLAIKLTARLLRERGAELARTLR